ncbi:translation initiation factor IF-5A [Candidatus Woesearchaeota archaeon]|nr:translation initiation factor IF-5A [Candidatus Woesearchaeota archaeon]
MTEIRQEEAASLKPGRYVIFDGKACIVKDNQISKTGKHGHAKCRIDAISIVASQRIVKMIMGSDRVEVPIIEKKTAQVLTINGNKASAMDTETYETVELIISEELTSEVKEGSEVVYWIVLDEKVIKQVNKK